jgi:hypothetical protein
MSTRTILFLLVCALALSTIPLCAQTQITVLNPSFEKPDSGKITGWDGKSKNPGHAKLIDIPGWRTDARDSSDWDSGLELSGTDVSDGKYRAFLMGTDTSMYQNLGKRVDAGDVITLTVMAKQNWPSIPGMFLMEIYYLDGDTANAPRVPLVTETKSVNSSWADYSVSFKASDHAASIGRKIGILFDNTTAPNSQSDKGGWINFDKVRLTNSNPTIVDVPNYSFELPDSGKVKGWDGVCSDPAWTNLQDIPGWTSDDPAYDSGVELGWTPVDGLYTAFIMGQDPYVYNITDHVIAAGEAFNLRAYGRITWAATTLRMALIAFDDATGNYDIIVYADEQLASDNSYNEYSLSFAANDQTSSIGRKLGILFGNVTSNPQSWLGIDNVRLNLVTGPTSVTSEDALPVEFALSQNYPNPFNPSTTIQYALKSSGKVRLSVYDVMGREVAVLVDGVQNAGRHKVTFSCANLASGIYFYKLQTTDAVIAKKMALVK